MIILLRVVKEVNARRIGNNLPPMVGGSREVNEAYSSFAKLYKVSKLAVGTFAES